jgi:hypothetical protein
MLIQLLSRSKRGSDRHSAHGLNSLAGHIGHPGTIEWCRMESLIL